MASASEDAPARRVHTVVLEGLVLLRIIKHCRLEATSQTAATGALLGLEADGVCEVTHCFPKSEDTNQTKVYDVSVMKMLKEVNVDHNSVGLFC